MYAEPHTTTSLSVTRLLYPTHHCQLWALYDAIYSGTGRSTTIPERHRQNTDAFTHAWDKLSTPEDKTTSVSH